MDKKHFMRKFHDNHFNYDYENSVINLGHEMFCHVLEEPKGVMSFLIYSDRTKENVKINYILETETICNLSDIEGSYRHRDLYIAIYTILTFLAMLPYETFSIEPIYKFGWLIDMAMYNPPKYGITEVTINGR